MGVWRRWIFPIIRILVFAAIGVALVKIAFFPEIAATTDPAVPGAEIIEPQVGVMLGTVQNDVVLDATIAAESAVPVKAPASGTVHKVFVAVGKTVAAGDALMTIWSDMPKDDGTSWIKESVVKASVAGVVSELALIVDQPTSVGEPVVQIAPASFRVNANLMPEQQYRLLTQPTEAEIVITGGPAPFTCTGLVIATAVASGQDNGGSGTTVTCAVPANIRVFSGLSATMTIAGGIAENVLVVPVTAVEGSAETGNVYLVLPDGSTEMRPVILGLSDGVNVEIKEGLVEGESILQFVPGAPGGEGEIFIDGEYPLMEG